VRHIALHSRGGKIIQQEVFINQDA
jgi:hypothetical protein